MTVLGGGVVLARRVTLVVPLAVLLNRGLPPICAVSGAPAQETLPTRISGRRAPLWLLVFGVVPYLVVRVLLGSGDTGVKVALPVSKAVADRLALARTTVIVAGVVAVLSVVAAISLWVGFLVLTALAVLAFAVAAMIDSAIAVRPTLVQGNVVLAVSHQLCGAVQAAPQPA